MLKGDISNQTVPIIAFCFENVLCKDFEKKLFGRFTYEIDRQVLAAINKLYWRDFRIVYVTFEVQGKKLKGLEENLENIGCLFNELIGAPDNETFKLWLRYNEGHYYDTDKDRVVELFPFSFMWEPQIVSMWVK